MNPIPYIHAFAWLAILGLTLFLAKSFLVPVAIVAGLCFIASFLLPKK